MKLQIFIILLAFFVSCQKSKLTTSNSTSHSKNTYFEEEDKGNLSDKLFYYWDGADEAPITKAVGFVLDQIKDEQGNYLNDDYEVRYRVKDETGAVLEEQRKMTQFVSVEASNIQGRAIVRIPFYQFLAQGQEGYFEVDFDVWDQGKSIAKTSSYIFVLKDKSKMLMDGFILGLKDATVRRLILEISTKLTLNDGAYPIYYKISDAPTFSANFQVTDQRAVLFPLQWDNNHDSDENLRIYVWYKDAKGETYFSEAIYQNKDFCQAKNPQTYLTQTFGLEPKKEYNKFFKRIAVHSGLQSRARKNHWNKDKYGIKTVVDEVTDYIHFRDYDSITPALQKGLQENGKKIGLNGKYISKKLKTLPQEILCFYKEVEEINLNNNLFENIHSRYEDLKLFPRLRVTKLANNNFSTTEKSKVNQLLAGKGLVWEEDKHHEAVYKNEGVCWMRLHYNYTCNNGYCTTSWMLWDQTYNTGTQVSKPHNNSCPFTYIYGTDAHLQKLHDPRKY